MKKYKYTWEQSDTYVCEFEAKNEEEAKEIINDNFDYNKGKLIGGDFNSLELKEVKWNTLKLLDKYQWDKLLILRQIQRRSY